MGQAEKAMKDRGQLQGSLGGVGQEQSTMALGTLMWQREEDLERGGRVGLNCQADTAQSSQGVTVGEMPTSLKTRGLISGTKLHCNLGSILIHGKLLRFLPNLKFQQFRRTQIKIVSCPQRQRLSMCERLFRAGTERTQQIIECKEKSEDCKILSPDTQKNQRK